MQFPLAARVRNPRCRDFLFVVELRAICPPQLGALFLGTLDEQILQFLPYPTPPYFHVNTAAIELTEPDVRNLLELNNLQNIYFAKM